MPSATAKPSNLPPRYSLPELALPAVLPTDAAALTALLHSVIAAHNDVKTQALSHIQHMMEQFILARHRMFDASSEQSSSQGRLFDEAVALIGKLYGIEHDHKDADDASRLLARQTHSVPALATLRTWLDKTPPGVTPKSALGTALSYLRDYWPRLTRYTEHGDLPIDNNRAENAIRPFVIGRKAWLFSDTVAGPNSSAVIYSVLETAKANGVEPYTWLRRVLRDLPAANTVDQVEALLPWNVKDLHTPDLTSDLPG